MSTQTPPSPDTKSLVRDKYHRIAIGESSCCGGARAVSVTVFGRKEK